MSTEKRYQVFVSSTFLDLREARSAVVSALLNLDAIPAGMELFPATDDDAWTLIESVIADSDYYLLVIGGKYGSIDQDLNIGYTEREYDMAVRLKIPVMAFLHGEPGKLMADQTELSEDKQARLKAFRDKVERAKHVKYWTSVSDLAGLVALTWNTFRKRYPAIGWIKADQATGQEAVLALARAQSEIEALKAQIEMGRTAPPSDTAGLAQGDNDLELPVRVHGSWTSSSSTVRSPISTLAIVETTWNRVFGYVGLRLRATVLREKEILQDIKLLLDRDNQLLFEAVLSQAAQPKALARGDTDALIVYESSDLDYEDFQTILLQFEALGFIERPTNDFWVLTSFGTTYLLQIRAVKAGERRLVRKVEKGSDAS